jgi:hypothetical protein
MVSISLASSISSFKKNAKIKERIELKRRKLAVIDDKTTPILPVLSFFHS